MTDPLPEDVMQLLRNIATENGLRNFTINVAAGSNHADGFLGIISRVSIVGQCENGEPTELSLIAKMQPSNEVRREQFGSNDVFAREILAYTKYLPLIDEFQKSKGLTHDNGFFTYPKCYGIINEPETKNYGLILEDLKTRNYEMWNKLRDIDLDHITLIVKEMAKMHGISYALRDQRPDEFKEFAMLNDLMVVTMTGENVLQYQDFCMDMTMKSLDTVPDNKHLVSKVEELKNDYVKLLYDCVTTDDFTIIGHGDCWSNNMMFTYNSDKTPREMCFLDWQLLRPASPALDLVYFLFTSTHKPQRDEHYDDWIRMYYTTMAETINAAGSDATKLFTLNDCYDQLKKYGKYGLLMAPMLLQVITADPKDIPDIDEMAEEMKKNAIDSGFMKMAQTEKFNVRMRDVIIDMVDYGYF